MSIQTTLNSLGCANKVSLCENHIRENRCKES